MALKIFTTAFGCLDLRRGCRLVAIIYTVWSFLNYIFTLATFSSPNFEILVNYGMIPERVDTFGRMWFALSTLCFWITHIVVDILMLVGVVKERLLLLPPFVLWCFVGALWELIFVVESMVEFTSNIQILVILYSTIVNVCLPIYFALLVVSYVEFVRDQGHVLPGDGIVLKNTSASILDLNNNSKDDKLGIAINQDNLLSTGSENTTIDFSSPRPAQVQKRPMNLLRY